MGMRQNVDVTVQPSAGRDVDKFRAMQKGPAIENSSDWRRHRYPAFSESRYAGDENDACTEMNGDFADPERIFFRSIQCAENA